MPSPEIKKAMDEATNEAKEEYGLKTEFDINNGHCQEWADKVQRKVPEAEFHDTPEDYDGPGHCWVQIGKLHYDAETIQGVEDWKDLKIFKTVREQQEKRLLSYESPLRIGSTMEPSSEERFKIVGKRLPAEMRDAIRELGKEMPIDFVELEDKEPGEPELKIETKCGCTTVTGPADKNRLIGELTGVSCETVAKKQRAEAAKETVVPIDTKVP